MRVVFLGTPDFAIPTLERLCQSRHEVLAVVTQPDRLGNRNKLMPPPVKVVAEGLGLPVLQYEKVSRQGVEDLRAMGADIFVTCAFGQILSRELLAMPKYGVINVHASILPKYRGSCPIQASIIAGDTETGVTIMRTAYEVDSGDVIHVKKVDILPNENAGELFDRLSVIGADALIEAMDMIENGSAVYTPQEHDKATFCHMIKKSDGEINWEKSALELHNFIRGMYPWPCAFTFLCGEVIKVHRAKVVDSDAIAQSGTVLDNDSRLIVACGSGALEILELQLSGGRRMSVSDYLRGHKIAIGSRLG